MSLILQYPVNGKISQPFGFDNSNHSVRSSFYLIFDSKHPGVDFDIDIGTEVKAAFPGIVVRQEFHQGMGNVVGARYGNIVILYAHLSKIDVSLGLKIKTGDLIGLSGDTGAACPHPHLHFEARDISRPTLKDMVFDPPFGKEIDCLSEQFVYKVNNTNTHKTWRTLAKLYFGDEIYWKDLANANESIHRSENEVIDQDTEVVIPNYFD